MAAAETGAISQSSREELLPGPSDTPRREKELHESSEQGPEPSGTRVPGNWIESPFSPVVTNRDQRLARALCGTQAPGCSGFVRPLLRRERRGGRSRMLLEPGGRRGGWIGILTLSGDSKGVSGFLELRLCALPHFPPRPPRVGFRLRNSTLKVDCLPRLVA